MDWTVSLGDIDRSRMTGCCSTTAANRRDHLNEAKTMDADDLSRINDPLVRGAIAAIHRAAQRARREALATKTSIVVSQDGCLKWLADRRLTGGAAGQPGATDAAEDRANP
jgi:hypothetical protein